MRNRPVRHDIDISRRGEFHDAVAGFDGSCAVVFDCGVGTAADYRSSGRNSRVARRGFRDASDSVRRFDQLRQSGRLKSCQGNEFL